MSPPADSPSALPTGEGREPEPPQPYATDAGQQWGVRDVDETDPDLVEDAGEPADGDLHVEPSGDHWWIRQHGSDMVVARCPTQALAVSSAREIAPATNARIVLHGADGAMGKIWRPRTG